MEVRYAVLARRDLERIELFYRTANPDITRVILGRIVAATRLLSEMPLAGPATARAKRRKWRVAQTPYIVFYRVGEDHIRILRVVHSAQAAAAY